MIFDSFHLDDAEGLILAHSLRVGDRMMKKGRLLSAEDVAALKQSGLHAVTGIRLEAEDVAEDEAASAVAEVLAGPGTARSAAFTGRCNIVATTSGLAVIDRERLDRLNLVDEAITVASLPPYEIVAARQVVATVKIIPFAVRRSLLETCQALMGAGGPLLRVAEFQPMQVALILTELPGTRPRILDATAQTMRARVEALGSSITSEQRVPHDEGAVERAITKALATGCRMVLISGASATVDRRDVVPSGITRAGGEIVHFGMPVDPGNLLLLARIGSIPVVDMPGCGRSAKLNGLDWVLQRLSAGIDITPRDIMTMGAGGLLKDISACPAPQGSASPPLEGLPHEARIGAVILAAGQSRRMGSVNKLLTLVDGRPMLRHVAEAALGSKAWPVVVVTGHQSEEVREALEGLDVTFVYNRHFSTGMASSLRCGLAAMPADVDGALICLGDMPLLRPDHLDRLIAAFDPDEARGICIPVHRGKRGNPVLLDRVFFEEMSRLEGDVGARGLIAAYTETVCEVVMEDDAVLRDVDSPEALAELDLSRSEK
ncbi:NTP transferase domain-containing protein [Telmatospirillum sp. J64-1]|uniref:NTP transferase domain-containing protein n=1 Tax=Telmatospirillum sp. J64-1 TaxID=2502183 RepID=UPI002105402D|nr:molybdopterin-binding/glycosyltransferase family 2 protein [Telmatospirillum sp. J64-1]